MTGISTGDEAKACPDEAVARDIGAGPADFSFDEPLSSLDARHKRIGASPMNLVEGKVSDSSLLVADFEVPLPDRTAARLAGRTPVGGAGPEHFEFSADPAARTLQGIATRSVEARLHPDGEPVA